MTTEETPPFVRVLDLVSMIVRGSLQLPTGGKSILELLVMALESADPEHLEKVEPTLSALATVLREELSERVPT